MADSFSTSRALNEAKGTAAVDSLCVSPKAEVSVSAPSSKAPHEESSSLICWRGVPGVLNSFEDWYTSGVRLSSMGRRVDNTRWRQLRRRGA